MEIIRSKDPARIALLAVVNQWLNDFGTEVVTVAKLIEKAEGKPEAGIPADSELKEAFIEVADRAERSAAEGWQVAGAEPRQNRRGTFDRPRPGLGDRRPILLAPAKGGESPRDRRA
jgi:hypothetical protein